MVPPKGSTSFYEQEVQNVLGVPPPRLLFTANTIIACVLVLVVICCAILPYPDTIRLPAELKVTEAFVVVKSPVDGTLSQPYNIDRKQVRSAETILQITSEAAEEHALQAPVKGELILLQPLQEGQRLVAEEELFAVVNRESPVSVNFQIPESLIGQIKLGQEVTIAIPGEGTVSQNSQGHIARIATLTDQRPGLASVPIDYPTHKIWVDGQQVTAEIMLSRKSVLSKILQSVL